ncbi:hypothetical protein HK405_000016 [Cladochytrium tenue]|nr:hypothetical protein HK405_000016 [Cladochytrium tenue]
MAKYGKVITTVGKIAGMVGTEIAAGAAGAFLGPAARVGVKAGLTFVNDFTFGVIDGKNAKGKLVGMAARTGLGLATKALCLYHFAKRMEELTRSHFNDLIQPKQAQSF